MKPITSTTIDESKSWRSNLTKHGEINLFDMQSLTGANGVAAHLEAVKKHYPERLPEKK